MTNVTMKGKTARGRDELKKHLSGKKLSYKQALLAKCYECTGGYVDGKMDCKIPDCSIYWYMPFGEAWKNRSKKLWLSVKSPFQRRNKEKQGGNSHLTLSTQKQAKK